MRSKRAIYNIITNILLQFITIIYGFIVPKIIISKFGSNANGLISSITQFLSYIALLESGFGPVIKSILYKPIAKNDRNKIKKILKSSELFFRRISYIFLIYIFVLCLSFPMLVNNDFDYLYTASLIIIISISTFAEYFFGMTYRLYLQAEQKTYVISIIQIITYILSIIIVVLLANIHTSIHIIKLFSGLIFVLRPLIQNYYIKIKYKINLNTVNEQYEIKQKWDGLAQHIAAVIHGNTDITILTLFTNLAEVSVYSVYYLIVKGIKSIIQSISSGVDATFGDMIAKNENVNLNKKFNYYEIAYFSLSTIIFSSAIVLITPFVSVYTKNISDVNYIRYLFGYLIVISEFIWAIRLPYSSITLSAGHFKETKTGAWIECFINIFVSIILVWKFGIIGVTIGTIVAMFVRTIEFIIHTNKYILNRNIKCSIKKIILVIFETIVVIIICNCLPYVNNSSYFNWFINAFITLIVATLIVIIFSMLFYKNEIKSILKVIKKIKK